MAETCELPAKLYFRIGEVAGLVGVEPHVLRYWEREFRSIRPTKSAKGQRVYSRKDVENLLRVKDLLYRDGFTIAGAKKQLSRPDVSPETTFESVEKTAVGLRIDRGDDVLTKGTLDPVAVEPTTVREKLVALRTEVESFLDDLDPTP